MSPAGLRVFLWGALAMGCWVSGLFFLRFWRTTRDRLFLIFAMAFWVFALEWTCQGLLQDAVSPSRYLVYLMRLAGFTLILGAVIDKNHRHRRAAPPDR